MDEYPLVNRMVLGLVEPAFGHLINKEELMLRNDADVIAALGMPEKFPTVTDDPEESKKLFTDYFRRMYGEILYTHVKHRNDGGDRDRRCLELEAKGNIPTKMAAGISKNDGTPRNDDGTPRGKCRM